VDTEYLSGSLKVRDNLGGFKRRRGDNIKADRKEIFRVYVICIQLMRVPVAYPGIFFGEWSNSVDRERGSGGGSPLVRGPGGSCNLVQEISFHIVNFS
jgi:hypothetical protein